MRLLIYNPDTDYALASGSAFYTPPASVKRLMEANPLQASAWGNPGDTLLLPDWMNIPEHECRGFEIARDRELGLWSDKEWSRVEGILPWGWNPALRHRLEQLGAPHCLLPSADEIARLRGLAHRRTTIAFNSMMGESVLPCEIISEDEGVAFWHDNPGCWFKAPWSSSGRGVICTDELNESHIRPWIRGIVRRQGSVMAETGVDKLHDFATEWNMADGTPEFLGYSYFEVSGRGKYKGNLLLSQEDILKTLNSHAATPIERIVEQQRAALTVVIGKDYNGPLGIDMMIDKNGKVWGCVEINLRRTMGHLALMK